MHFINKGKLKHSYDSSKNKTKRVKRFRLFHFKVFISFILFAAGLQTDLDDKMKELQSKSDTVTALGEWLCSVAKDCKLNKYKSNGLTMKMVLLSALQVSTLTVQVEGLKRQAQDTVSEVKVKGLFACHDTMTILKLEELLR